jgi:hypothetical protein
MFMLVAPIAMVGVLIFARQQQEHLRFWLYVSFCSPLVVYILTLFSRSYEVFGGAVVLLLFESALAFLVFSAVFTYLKKIILASISMLSLFFLYFPNLGLFQFSFTSWRFTLWP